MMWSTEPRPGVAAWSQPVWLLEGNRALAYVCLEGYRSGRNGLPVWSATVETDSGEWLRQPFSHSTDKAYVMAWAEAFVSNLPPRQLSLFGEVLR